MCRKTIVHQLVHDWENNSTLFQTQKNTNINRTSRKHANLLNITYKITREQTSELIFQVSKYRLTWLRMHRIFMYLKCLPIKSIVIRMARIAPIVRDTGCARRRSALYSKKSVLFLSAAPTSNVYLGNRIYRYKYTLQTTHLWIAAIDAYSHLSNTTETSNQCSRLSNTIALIAVI